MRAGPLARLVVMVIVVLGFVVSVFLLARGVGAAYGFSLEPQSHAEARCSAVAADPAWDQCVANALNAGWRGEGWPSFALSIAAAGAGCAGLVWLRIGRQRWDRRLQGEGVGS